MMAKKQESMIDDGMLDVSKYIQLAEAQIEARKNAPVASLHEISIVRKDLMKQNCPESFGKDAQFHCGFVPIKELKKWSLMGRIPVTYSDRSPVIEGEDILVKTSKQIWDEKINRAGAVSQFRLGESTVKGSDVKGADKAVDEKIEKITPDDPRHATILANPESAFDGDDD